MNTNDHESMYYDGADRKVEDVSGAGVKTRYLYDLTQNGTLGAISFNGGAPFYAHGGLYKTETTGLSTQFRDLRGWAYDALDRAVKQYVFSAGASGVTLSYDTDQQHQGLLAKRTDELGVVTSYSYDNDGNKMAVTFSDGTTPNQTDSYDPDGRPVSLASSVATDTYQYDGDGRDTQSSQNIAGTTGAEVLTYGYYNDGLRKALSIAGPAGTQSNLETYTYRTDGLRASEQFTDASTSANFAWTYTGAGREQTVVDPWSTRTKTYNSYGQVATDTIPAGTYSNFVYGDNGEVGAYTAYAGTAQSFLYPNTKINATQIPITTDPDGQLQRIGYSAITNNMVPKPTSSPAPFQDATMLSCDAFCDGQKNGGYSGSTCLHLQPNNGCSQTTLDVDGRQNGYQAIWEYNSPNCGQPSGCPTKSVQVTYTHDAQDHMIACSATGDNDVPTVGSVGSPLCQPDSPMSITYSPSGHVAKYSWTSGSTVTTTPMYWDGDQLLLYGSQVYLGTFAVFDSTVSQHLTVLDRDFSGNIVSEHNGSGFSGWGAPAPAENVVIGGVDQGTSGFVGTTGLVTNPKGDGYSIGGLLIQGARAYNPQVGAWTAPDAFQGDVSDPRSMSPYMWENNNPLSFSDPSGYFYMAPGSGYGSSGGITGAVDEAAAYMMGSILQSEFVNNIIASLMDAMDLTKSAIDAAFIDVSGQGSHPVAASDFWSDAAAWANVGFGRADVNLFATSTATSMKVSSSEVSIEAKGSDYDVTLTGHDLTGHLTQVLTSRMVFVVDSPHNYRTLEGNHVGPAPVTNSHLLPWFGSPTSGNAWPDPRPLTP